MWLIKWHEKNMQPTKRGPLPRTSTWEQFWNNYLTLFRWVEYIDFSVKNGFMCMLKNSNMKKMGADFEEANLCWIHSCKTFNTALKDQFFVALALSHYLFNNTSCCNQYLHVLHSEAVCFSMDYQKPQVLKGNPTSVKYFCLTARFIMLYIFFFFFKSAFTECFRFGQITRTANIWLEKHKTYCLDC